MDQDSTNASVATSSEQPTTQPIQDILPQRAAVKRASELLNSVSKRSSRSKLAAETVGPSDGDEPMSEDGSVNRSNGLLGSRPGFTTFSTSSTTSVESPPPRRKPIPTRTYGKFGKKGLGGRRSTNKPPSSSDSSLSPAPPSPPAQAEPLPKDDDATPSRSLRKRSRPSTGTKEKKDTATPTKRRKEASSTPKSPSRASVKGKGKAPLRMSTSVILPLQASSKPPYEVAWIKLDGEGKCAAVDGSGVVWWPSKVFSSPEGTEGVTVELLGSTLLGGRSNRRQNISSTDGAHTLTFRNGSAIRFNSSTCLLSDNNMAVTGSASTPDKTLMTNWKQAYQDACALDQYENDELPDPTYLALSQSASSLPSQPQPKSTSFQTSTSPAVEWQPDPELEPGTGVLARDGSRNKKFWPARVQEIVPPTSPGGQGTYRLLFFEGSTKDIPRGKIHALESEEFLTCELGKIKTAGEEQDDEEARRSPIPRDPSPPLPSLAPTEAEFLKLDLRPQVSCIRPIMQKIILNEYRWATPRHEAFMAGGRQRQNLTQQIKTGDLSPANVADVLNEIRRWALRGERWAQPAPDESQAEVPATESKPETDADVPMRAATPDLTTVPSAEYPRPKGCPEYEALGGSARSQYCSDVLLPEALIQLQALRDGLRGGPIPHTDDASEHSIYESASQKLAQAEPLDAWVDQLLAIREQRLRLRQPLVPNGSSSSFQEPKASPLKGSTRSRRSYK